MNGAPDRTPGRGRRALALLAVLFALPVVAATVLYFSGWRPSGAVNHGQLVSPARPIADALFQTLDGTELRLHALHGKWSLVYFGPAECAPACERSLYKMRQVHAAQGRESDRVQRVFVVTDRSARDRLRDTLRDYPGMIVLTGPEASVRALAEQFRLAEGAPAALPERIYVLDPNGNFMMHYPPEADPSGMRKDLARLLRLSRIG